MNAPTLKPCPFCGKSPSSYNGYIVTFCDCIGEDFEDSGPRIESWQSRPIEDALQAEIERLRVALDFHPRAAKLMNKRKSFIVVADDEPYFHEVYSLIREHEIQKGTWTNEDQRIYEDATNALKGGE